jgi:hypothetical protein
MVSAETLLREAIQNVTDMRADIERGVQMQLFATFMLVLAIFDVYYNVRRYVHDEVRAQRDGAWP